MSSCLSFARREKYKILLLLGVLTLTVWKCPALFIHPRFWAEEGVIVFGLMYKEGLSAILSYNIGYFSIVPLITSFVLALVTNIYYAPVVTLLISLLVQMIVLSIPIFGNSVFWDTYRNKIVICLAIISLTQAEIWLTTNATQYWFCLGTFMIFVEEVKNSGELKKYLYRIFLAVGCLNGVMSCFLLPVYLCRAFVSGYKEHSIQAFIVFACSVLQGSLVLYSSLGHNAHLEMRTSGSYLPLMHYVHKQFLWPFLGYPTDNMYENFFLRVERFIDIPPFIIVVFPIVFILLLAVFIIVLFFDVRESVLHRYVIIAFIVMFALNCKFALMHKLGGRYVFVNSIILFIILMDRCFNSKKKIVRYVSTMIVSVTIFLGLRQYTNADFLGTTGPVWREEVDKWKSDCSYKPKVWPYSPGRIWEIEMPCRK